jgi:peptide/nickel transport system permease protein
VLYAALSVPSFLLALLLIYVCIFHSWGLRLMFGVGGVAAAIAVIGRRLRIHAADDDPDGRSPLRLAGAVLGGLLIAVVAVLIARNWPQFPRRGFVRLTSDDGLWANLRSAFLPAATLAIAEVAVFSRLLRSDMITTLQEDYILAARSRGLPRRRILRVHALRPSTFSLITVAGVSFGRLIGGTVVVEQVFGIPGIGTLMLDAIRDKDYRVVQAAVLLVAAFYVVVNTLVDISYLYLDPRTRRARH